MSLWLEGGQGKWVGSLGLGIRQDTLPGLGQPGGDPPPHTSPQLTNAYLRLKGQLSVLYPLCSMGTLGMAQVGHCAGGSGLQGQPAGQEEGRTVFAFGEVVTWEIGRAHV